MLTKIAATAAAIILLASAAHAKDVENATVVHLESGGLQGINPGCLYVLVADPAHVGTTDMYVLPLNVSPNTPQLVAAMTLETHSHVSFNLGPASGSCPAAPSSPSILRPSAP